MDFPRLWGVPSSPGQLPFLGSLRTFPTTGTHTELAELELVELVPLPLPTRPMGMGRRNV